jgi:hypothetical protein
MSSKARIKANRRKRLHATNRAFSIEDKLAGLPPMYRKLNNKVDAKMAQGGRRVVMG